jgi:histone H3/H4
MSTSGKVPDRLSQAIRKLCDTAIENAQKDGRKTVMDRDIPEATL